MQRRDQRNCVAPLAGAWIEINELEVIIETAEVAPLAGAWIEIQMLRMQIIFARSLPSRERGLK